MERSWWETAARAAEAAAGNGAWLCAMTAGAFALALGGERVLALTLG